MVSRLKGSATSRKAKYALSRGESGLACRLLTKGCMGFSWVQGVGWVVLSAEAFAAGESVVVRAGQEDDLLSVACVEEDDSAGRADGWRAEKDPLEATEVSVRRAPGESGRACPCAGIAPQRQVKYPKPQRRTIVCGQCGAMAALCFARSRFR